MRARPIESFLALEEAEMTARNPTRPTFCSAVEPLLHRIDRWSYRVLRTAGWVVLALALLGTVTGG